MPRVTRKAMSITVKTGYLTQISAIFMRFRFWLPLLGRHGAWRFRLLLHSGAVAQITGDRDSYAVTGFEAISHFEAAAAFVFGLAGGANLTLGNVIAVEQEDFVDAIAIVDGGVGQEDRFLLLFTGNRSLHEEAGLQTAIQVFEQSFGFKSA